MFDMIETEVHGYYWKIELECGCRFEWYHHKYTGIRMISPPDDREIHYINGMKYPQLSNGESAIHPSIQQLSDAKAAIFKIICPNHKTFKTISKTWLDLHYSEFSGTDSIWTTRHHGTYIGGERIS